MAGKKYFKDLVKALERLGYEKTGTSGAGGSYWVYANDRGQEITISPGVAENAARQILRKLERDAGMAAKAPKRNAEAIKERQATERQKAREENERLETERLRIVIERDALLSGAGSHLTNAQIRALEDRVAEIEREQRELVALMTAKPVASAHSGNGGVRHRSGDR